MIYEWINLELFDYDNEQDWWDLINLFDKSSFEEYRDLPPSCPFVFLIQKYREEKGEIYSKKHETIGFIFLESKNIKEKSLFLHFGITEKERNKGYMKESLRILNHKLIGETTEMEKKWIEYEKFLQNLTIVALNSNNDPIVEHLLKMNSMSIESDDKNFYYVLGFTEEKKQLLKRKGRK